MQRCHLEVADILKEHGGEFLRRCQVTATSVLDVMGAILQCRTAALGGHLSVCLDCGKSHQSYNSCRNRHCPKCLGSKTAEWMEKRSKELLPIPYFHVVFTLPHEFNPLALRNKARVYDILLRTAWQTLQEVAANPKHLGAQIGAFGILHTWNQTLQLHPHVHFVVTGGGLSKDKSRWISSRNPKFFAPVRVLQKVFRGKFIDALKQDYAAGKLSCIGSTAELNTPKTFEKLLNCACSKPWNVYCKPPLHGKTETLKYLASYTHRIAISNQRLLTLQQGEVTFSYRDSADGCQRKNMTLPAVEFIRRFMLHIVPKNFYRIRHFGFLANAYRTQHLKLAQALLIASQTPTEHEPEHKQIPGQTAQYVCQDCGSSNLIRIPLSSPALAVVINTTRTADNNYWDSS